MEVLVVYDIATDNSAGRGRLRRVAQTCQAYGQRVQKSVFECVLTETELEMLVARLRREIDEATDSVRIYRLREPRRRYVRVFGTRPAFDPREPLVF